ncbi:hypothetical protein PAMA_001063 [Pampus argenteus]
MDGLIQAAERWSPASTESADESHLARAGRRSCLQRNISKAVFSTFAKKLYGKVFVVLLLAEALERWLEKRCRAARTSRAARDAASA